MLKGRYTLLENMKALRGGKGFALSTPTRGATSGLRISLAVRQREAVFDCSLAGRVFGTVSRIKGCPTAYRALPLPLDTDASQSKKYDFDRRNTVKGGCATCEALDGEGADTL